MSIILKELKFSNMFSYGENNKISFNKNRITQLTAPNGSGKSSIALILQEVLYNKNIKGIKKGDILNRHSTSKNWGASLSFSSLNKEYVVEIKRTGATTKVKFLENETDLSEHKVLDTYKKINEIIGLDFEVFSQLTYQSSTDLLEFLKATDTNRKKFLINLFNLEKYITIGEAIKVKLNSSDREQLKLEGELKGVVNFLESTTIEEEKETIKVPNIDDTLRNSVARLENELADYNDLCKKIDKNNMLIDERNSLSFDVAMTEPEYKIYDNLQSEITKIQTEIQSIDKDIAKGNKSLSDLDTADTCYACGQALDNTHAVQMKEKLWNDINDFTQHRNVAREKLFELKIQKNEIQSEIDVFLINQKAAERFENLSQLIDFSLQTDYPDYSDIQNRLTITKEELNKQEKIYKEATEHNEQVKIHNTKVEALKEQKIQFTNRQKLLDNDIIILQNKNKHLNILKKAFSTTGIVAFKLENLTKELEEQINQYLSELSDGQFQVIFRLAGEKLNIVVINNGIETPIETVSGGEFSRIQTSILLAIRKVMSKIGGNHVNLLFLDEITGVLDDEGKEKLIEVLREEDGLNVFLISHDFTHPLIDKIQIKKENNVSTI
jgi:DNA repair exonuclease SbcCD ATPase subunit